MELIISADLPPVILIIPIAAGAFIKVAGAAIVSSESIKNRL
jgi:hypothetical protein